MQFHLIFTICVPTIAKAILSSEKAGADLGGVRWVRTNPPFADSFDLLVLCYSQQRSTLSAGVPVQFGYCSNLLRAIQFNVHAQCNFSRRRVLIKMGVVWQKWAWSPKIFRALFQKNPPSLIPGSAPGKSVPPTVSPHRTDGEKECTPHCFTPPYRWGARVYYTLFPLQYGGNPIMYPTLFFTIVIRWEKRVYPLHSFSPSYRGKTFKE